MYAYNGGQEKLKQPLSERWKENREYPGKVKQYASNLGIIRELVPGINYADRVAIAKEYGHKKWDITQEYITQYMWNSAEIIALR